MNTPTTTPPEPGLRQRLADRLVDYPFLSLLVLNPAFSAVLALAVLGAIVLAVAVPKLWVSTPPGFKPEVKISLVDKVQAWSLRRSAVKFAASGQAEAASRAWVTAIGNNPGDAETIRGFLRHVAGLPNPSGTVVGQFAGQAQWLLGLTGTNRNDAGLVAQTCDRLALYGVVLGLLEPLKDNLSPLEEAAFQKALFLAGRINDFAERTARFPTAAADPELALCTAAFNAGWGPPQATAAAREQLTRAATDPALGVMATRLQLLLSLKLIDPEGYAQALQRLQTQAVDQLAEHTRYWQLLTTTGRRAEARRRAEDYRATPRNAFDVVQLTEALLALGMQEYALKTLQRFVPLFGEEGDPGGAWVWTTYAKLLIQAKAWDDLFAAAVQMRSSPRNGKDLAALSYYLEGRALIGQERIEESSVAFARAVAAPFPTPEAGLEAAEVMLQSGHAALAARLLRELERSLNENARYWQMVFEAAFAERTDHVLFLHAARQAYRLAPTNELFHINYAAALLINREAPAEASRLTLLFQQQHPDLLIARLNHSFALAQNQRLDEAEELLETIAPGLLKENEATMYHLCWVQVRFGQRRFGDCQEHLASINTNHLFPIQRQWLDGVRTQVKSAGLGG